MHRTVDRAIRSRGELLHIESGRRVGVDLHRGIVDAVGAQLRREETTEPVIADARDDGGADTGGCQSDRGVPLGSRKGAVEGPAVLERSRGGRDEGDHAFSEADGERGGVGHDLDTTGSTPVATIPDCNLDAFGI